MTAPIKSWSPQQLAFFDWAENGTGSCVLEAVAGAGKTTALLEATGRIKGQVAILAYNKKIADELKEKLTEKGFDFKKAQAGTVHSFGMSAVRKANPKVKVEEYKVLNLIETLRFDASIALHAPKIAHLVSLAKQRALGVLGRIEDDNLWWDIVDHFGIFEGEDDVPADAEAIVKAAQETLLASNEQTDFIDFDDMIYFPLIHKLPMWQFNIVMVDEAQDTNAARRALVRALVRKGGRVIAVGDRHQAIYGFTGADSDALDLIAHDFNAIRLPLTTTYRCPKAVVAFSQRWVSHIHAAESAPEGSVTGTTLADFLKRNDLDGNAAVLCRVTKPIVKLAFQLIRQRVPCRVEGREVGSQLKKLVTRWKVDDFDALETKLDAHLERERTKLLAKKKEAQFAVIEDAVETVKVILDQCRAEGRSRIADAVAYIDSLFGDNVKGMLVLSTIHKAKGREWERVFWLDRANTCPSKWARQAWEQEQENNLCYVAATRAKDQLIEVTV